MGMARQTAGRDRNFRRGDERVVARGRHAVAAGYDSSNSQPSSTSAADRARAARDPRRHDNTRHPVRSSACRGRRAARLAGCRRGRPLRNCRRRYLRGCSARRRRYLIKSVLMDEEDDQVVTMLECRSAVAPSARSIVIEHLRRARTHPTSLSDATMMVMTDGRERTREEFVHSSAPHDFASKRSRWTSSPFTLVVGSVYACAVARPPTWRRLTGIAGVGNNPRLVTVIGRH